MPDTPPLAAARDFKLAYFSATGSELPSLGQALRQVLEMHPDMRVNARTGVQLFDSVQAGRFAQDALDSDAVVLALHGGKASCPAYDAIVAGILEQRKQRGRRPFFIIHSVGGDEEALGLALELSDGLGDRAEASPWLRLCRYLHHGGRDNHHLFLEALLRTAGLNPESPELAERVLSLPLPHPLPQQGIFHPSAVSATGGTGGADGARGYLASLEEWRAVHYDSSRPTIGMWFYQTDFINGNLDSVSAIIEEIERQGGNALAVFHNRHHDPVLGNMDAAQVAESFFRRNGKTCIDTLLNPMGFSLCLSNAGYSTVLPGLDVPCLQIMNTYQTREEWERSDLGLSSMEVSYLVAQPEFDGTLITVPAATIGENEVDPLTGALWRRHAPLPERINSIVRRAMNWARLRHLPNAQRKVAVVFHNYPARNDRIGCAVGLDSFASVRVLLDAMRARGYDTGEPFADAAALTTAILDSMTWDGRWLPPEKLAERAVATVPAAVARERIKALAPQAGTKQEEDWGPAPGSLFVHDSAILLPGLMRGNVFLTIQPPRGGIENIDAFCHDPWMTPPHIYNGLYDFIRKDFGAHAVIHVGKHGSLEWLPGKGIGLSAACWPDIAIDDIPNIYPYIINDPSEGTQAKRRSYCAIVDHMTPVFTNADLYEELGELDELLRERGQAVNVNDAKVDILNAKIWRAACAADIHHSLGLDENAMPAPFEPFLEKLHDFLSSLADTMISNGLHTLGQAPCGEGLNELLTQLVRIANGEIPSLRESLLAHMGFSYDDLLRNRGKVITGSPLTGGGLIALAHQRGLDLMAALERAGYAPDRVPEAVWEVLGHNAPVVEQVLRYVTETLVPAINETHAEITSCLHALEGGFVPPGPSGAPTRGQAGILPTGRNFYSVDPQKIPSPGAWEVGMRLGDALLAAFRESHEGRWPENVGIIVYGGPTMRSNGDDVAEILYLLGVRPVWEKSSGKVKGLEIIPPEELGRPRIDVTPRISGFFRDCFPNLVELMDDAVQLVAALKHEDGECNPIRKHVIADRESYLEQGLSEDEAWRMASLRIFGCPPGTYGAGVAELVESKRWKDRTDLGEAYIFFSSHAYGRNLYGKKQEGAFRSQLARMDATVKNEDSREYDILSCTDYYNYFGGYIAAVETVRGVQPWSVVGDSSDPKRVGLRTTAEEAQHILRARLLNPKWISGLQRHGYKGAGDLSKMLDVIIGWDATAGIMEDWMYERVSQKYALDREMAEWMKRVNPYARQNIIDKLLEAAARGMWNAKEETLDELRDAYLDIEGSIEEAVDD